LKFLRRKQYVRGNSVPALAILETFCGKKSLGQMFGHMITRSAKKRVPEVRFEDAIGNRRARLISVNGESW
jgi:hypothetical protein